jgi:hypothetical protein
MKINENYSFNSLNNSIRILTDNLTQNSTNSNEIQTHASFLSAKTLVAIIILLLYTIATPVFEKFHFHYIHESGICMILGLIVGLVSMLMNPLVIKFVN